ncbi:PilZ domain-containing protein [Desulfogranum marinum]|uniref:PilZ domain-containing protein n=1 Tax=Desulfogranum marinum TaxID=453220 RepID=UPI0029C90DBF|nr:PilZ domain-containing protein [Desulfogranum marinum]
MTTLLKGIWQILHTISAPTPVSTLTAPEDRRKAFRMPFNADVVCRDKKTGIAYQGRLKDISALGVFIEASDPPPVGSVCELEIALQGSSSRLVIDKLKGTIVRHVNSGMAIRFDDRLEWIALVPIYFHKMKP